LQNTTHPLEGIPKEFREKEHKAPPSELKDPINQPPRADPLINKMLYGSYESTSPP